MNSISTALIFIALTASALAGDWSFHFDAEKGEQTVAIAYEPKPLEAYLFQPPSYSPDPLGHDAKVFAASVERIGSIAEHTLIEAKTFVGEDCYTNVFLVLLGVGSGKFVPCFGLQYNSGTREPRLTNSSWRDNGVTLEYTVFYSGTGGHRVVYDVEVSFEDQGRPRVVTKEKIQDEEAQPGATDNPDDAQRLREDH